MRGGNVNGNWEIDFWGRITRSIASADADFQASIEDYRDVLVILYADIAANYVNLRTLQERIVVTQRNVDTQRGTLGITQARFKAELSPELDVRQAELNLARTESTLPALRQGGGPGHLSAGGADRGVSGRALRRADAAAAHSPTAAVSARGGAGGRPAPAPGRAGGRAPAGSPDRANRDRHGRPVSDLLAAGRLRLSGGARRFLRQ